MRYLCKKKNNRNKDKIEIRKLSAILIAALACLCWLFALTQLISSLASPIKSIPAFLSLQANAAGDSTSSQKEDEIETVIPAFRPSSLIPTTASQLSTDMVFSSPEEVLSYLQGYDKDIRLVSSHQESNYLDLYFYSPLLQKSSNNNSFFNMQVAVTKNRTYFGTPFINYDF